MATVFITQQSRGKNIEPARKFGDINVILQQGDTRPGCDYKALLERLESELAGFDPDQDYLLNIGDPHVTGMAYAIVMDKTGGNLCLLKWVMKSQEYVSSEIDVAW